MFFNFIDELRAAGIKASFKEHLTLLEALDKDVIEQTPEAFYYLSRATFVKDEGLLDRFDQVFNKVFKGILSDYGQQPVEIPEDWLKQVAERYFSEEEIEKIKALGDWDEIMETLKKRIEEQEKRHSGGNKWIGTGGTSPFGHGGYNPQGVRIGGAGKNRSAVKVLLFLDVGGSMDPHIKLVEELFSAASAEFKNLEFFYFHNCPYEGVWKDNRRRFAERTPMWDVLHKFGHDYKLVIVGDGSMSPYEITHPGGSVEHFNEESGAVWLHRLTTTYPAAIWLNPIKEEQWGYSQSIKILREVMNDRMYPLTLAGLDDAMRELTRKR